MPLNTDLGGLYLMRRAKRQERGTTTRQNLSSERFQTNARVTRPCEPRSLHTKLLLITSGFIVRGRSELVCKGGLQTRNAE